MTYTERVYTIAEKMAKEEQKIFPEFMPDEMKITIDGFLPAARIAVGEMAELSESFYHAEAMRDGWGLDQVNEVVDRKLKEQGLIPDDGQEARTNEH